MWTGAKKLYSFPPDLWVFEEALRITDHALLGSPQQPRITSFGEAADVGLSSGRSALPIGCEFADQIAKLCGSPARPGPAAPEPAGRVT